MRKPFYAAIATATTTALVLLPTRAWAQLPIDMTTDPTKETGGWVWYAQILVLVLGLGLAFLVLLGFLRWAPVWAHKRAAGAPPRPEAPPLAPAIAKPESSVVAAQAAAASAVSSGEKAHEVQEGAVPTADAHVADGPGTGDAARGGADDVYGSTLDELLAKGVPQKVAEARAKVAAKKAGG